jgi:hypothetical protein
VVDVPSDEAAAVLAESGWVEFVPPEPTPGIVPGTEDPKPTRKRKESTPAGAEGDDQQ